jgi:putative transposase
MLTALKRDPDHLWLAGVDSMALQESLRNLDRAYKNFFEKRAGCPKFKAKRDSRQSYRTRNNKKDNIRIEGDRIRLPRLGLVKARITRLPKGSIQNATVSRTSTGKYYVSLCCREEIEPKPNKGGEIGIDLGIRDLFVGSDGSRVPDPKHLAKHERKLRREQRRLSRRQKGSANREKQRRKVAEVHEKIYNCRTDDLNKASCRLVNENQVIAVESLNVKGMARNHHLAKAISDASWSRFITMLEYKAFEYGCTVLKVPTFYPSSQTCSCCGYKDPKVKDLSVRRWVCPGCGTIHDRDENAARNILAEALSMQTA